MQETLDYLVKQRMALETLYLRGYMSYADYEVASNDIFEKIKAQLFDKKVPIGDFDVCLAAAIVHNAGYISTTEYGKITGDLNRMLESQKSEEKMTELKERLAKIANGDLMIKEEM